MKTRLTILFAILLLPLCSAFAGSFYREDVSSTPMQVFTGSGRVYGLLIINDNAVQVFVHRYDALAGNVTVGTTPQNSAPWPIAANGYLWLAANGNVHGQYSTGLTIAVTSGTTGDKSTATTAPTTPLTVSIGYQQ